MVIEYPTKSNNLNQKTTQLNNGYHSSTFYEQVATLLETNYHNSFDNDYDLMINERKAEALSSLEKA